MEDRVRKMSCNLSNRYLNPGFKELRNTIADHHAPSWGQMYFLVELCKKTIEELEKNPPEEKEYYGCYILCTCGPKDFLIGVLEVIEETEEFDFWLPRIVMEWEERELFLTALQIIGKYLGLISHKEIPIVNRSEYRITIDPYSYSSNFDQLEQIGSDLVRIGSFVRSENLYSSLDVLSSVINELETECRRLNGFLNWFQQCIGNSGSFYRDIKNFRFLQKGAPAAGSNSVRLANGLRECGSKIKHIKRGLSGLGQEAKPFQLEDPKNLEIIDDLNGYLEGLKYTIRQLKEQLSEKEKAEQARKYWTDEDIAKFLAELSEPNDDPEPVLLGQPRLCPKSELPEHPDKENRQ